MKKRILSVLVLLALIVPMASSMAATSAVTQLKNDLINANKKVLNNAATTAKTNATNRANAKIAAYEKQIAAKQAEIQKIKNNENYKWTEKYKKVRAVNKEIKELRAAIRAID